MAFGNYENFLKRSIFATGDLSRVWISDSFFRGDRLFLCSAKVNDMQSGSEVICGCALIKIGPVSQKSATNL